jgi:hypothetical protein
MDCHSGAAFTGVAHGTIPTATNAATRLLMAPNALLFNRMIVLRHQQ